MHLGSKHPKLSWTSRRIRLGVANSGTPSSWIAPSKDTVQTERKQQKKNRR
jgi:hypothetical protein